MFLILSLSDLTLIMPLTQIEKKALLSMWYSKRHLIFIDKYIKSQKEWENMDKKASLFEILWLEKYNEFIVTLQSKPSAK